MLGDAEKARNAAEAAASDLFGVLALRAAEPLEALQEFTKERLALEDGDIRTVRDERFDGVCGTLEEMANELHYAGRLGKPGARPPLALLKSAEAADEEARRQREKKQAQKQALQGLNEDSDDVDSRSDAAEEEEETAGEIQAEGTEYTPAATGDGWAEY